MNKLTTLVLFMPLVVWGCEGDGGSVPQSDNPEAAAGGACAFEKASPDWLYPDGPYGSDAGDRISDFELTNCDGQPTRLADVLHKADIVLLNIGAGWCTTCEDETETMEADLQAPFCSDGLGIVQVLVEDKAGLPATKLFCKQWEARFGLSFPVLIDPLGKLSDLMGGDEVPINILLDSDGVILDRSSGFAPGDLDMKIDALL